MSESRDANGDVIAEQMRESEAFLDRKRGFAESELRCAHVLFVCNCMQMWLGLDCKNSREKKPSQLS